MIQQSNMLNDKELEGKPTLAPWTKSKRRTKKDSLPLLIKDLEMAKTENDDLNLHVQLCSERYKSLEDKIHAVETKITHIEQRVGDLNKTIQSNFLDLKIAIEQSNGRRDVQLIASIGAVVVAVISGIFVWLNH